MNRLYYGVFHAAQAVLYASGENPSSHGDVRRLFGQRIVLEGEASREEGRLLGTLYDYRREADYGSGRPDADVASLFDEELHDLKERGESYNDGVQHVLEVYREHGPRQA